MIILADNLPPKKNRPLINTDTVSSVWDSYQKTNCFDACTRMLANLKMHSFSAFHYGGSACIISLFPDNVNNKQY